MKLGRAKTLPIAAARSIAKGYGFDQVVIVARRVGEDGTESVASYGVTREHCGVAALMANVIKKGIMGWKSGEVPASAKAIIRKEAQAICDSNVLLGVDVANGRLQPDQADRILREMIESLALRAAGGEAPAFKKWKARA